MKRSRVVFVAASAAIAVGLFVACTFPDVAFAPGGAETGTGDGGSGSDSSLAEAMSDASRIDAPTHGDADTRVDAAGCTTCDCDGDQFFARVDGGCEGGPGTVFDCDDTDTSVSPDSGFVNDVKWPSNWPVVYDWNCSGKVEKSYPFNLKCAYALTTCTGGQGYLGDPGCGTTADYFECQDKGALTGGCVAVKIDDQRPQLCK